MTARPSESVAGAPQLSESDSKRQSLTPEQRSSRARLAAYAQHAAHDTRATTAKARATFLASFDAKVDPDRKLPEAERTRRAEAARRAHFQTLAYRSSRARSARTDK